MIKTANVYIMTNQLKTSLYIGVTTHLKERIYQHKTHYYKGSFTDRYNLEYCIYYEYFQSIAAAIAREKEIKKWRREKKEKLINTINPSWEDLWEKEIQYW